MFVGKCPFLHFNMHVKRTVAGVLSLFSHNSHEKMWQCVNHCLNFNLSWWPRRDLRIICEAFEDAGYTTFVGIATWLKMHPWQGTAVTCCSLISRTFLEGCVGVLFFFQYRKICTPTPNGCMNITLYLYLHRFVFLLMSCSKLIQNIWNHTSFVSKVNARGVTAQQRKRLYLVGFLGTKISYDFPEMPQMDLVAEDKQKK